MNHIGNDGYTIEKTGHFCNFLLQMWSEVGQKATSGSTLKP
jgi:hypothetical protein